MERSLYWEKTMIFSQKKMKRFFDKTSRGAVNGEIFAGALRNVLKNLVLERVCVNWIDGMKVVTKIYSITEHSSTKLTPTQGTLKKNKTYFFIIFLAEEKKPFLKLEDLDRSSEKNF